MSGAGPTPRPPGAPSERSPGPRTVDTWGGWPAAVWGRMLFRVQAVVALVVAVSLVGLSRYGLGMVFLLLAGLLALVPGLWSAERGTD